MTKKLLTKISTGVTTGVLLIGCIVPAAFASTHVTIQNNGAFSNNGAFVTHTNTSSKTQSNSTFVSNTVTTTAHTGNNNSSFNTNGGSVIYTGAAMAIVDVHNAAGLNINLDPACGCQSSDTSATIDSNGAFSTNTITLEHSNSSTLSQTNSTTFVNSVTTTAHTGGNTNSFNTGSGTGISTGDATSSVGVTNVGSANVAL